MSPNHTPTQSAASGGLIPAFEALARAKPARVPGPNWVPYATIAGVVLVTAALLVAFVLEDHKLQRAAAQRDVDSGAQRIGARLATISEALSTAALELGTGDAGERRFIRLARDLAASKSEVLAVARVDMSGRSEFVAGNPALVAAMTEALGPLPHGAAGFVSVSDDAARPTLVYVARVDRRTRPIGALVGVIDSVQLIREGVEAEIGDKYQLGLRAGELWLGGAAIRPSERAAHAAAVPTLPAHFKLVGAPVPTTSPLRDRAMPWVIVALAAAIVIALAALVRHTIRQAAVDRALLAETALRRAMENSLATGLRVLDMEGTIRYVNRAFCRMTGWSEPDLVGTGAPFRYWPPDQITENEIKHRRVLAGDVPAEGFEVVAARPDGSRFDARMYVSPLQDDAGRQIGWLSSMTDVTEPNRIRNALAEAHRQFLTVLEALDAAVSVIDDGAQPALLFANRGYRAWLGEHAAGHVRLAAALAERQVAGGVVHDPQTHRWFDARIRSIRWPAQTDGGERRASLLIAADITLRKATEEITRKQQEKVQFTARLMTLGEMASSLAHELNQPLTAIANYCEGTLARVAAGRISEAELRAALDKTSAQAQRAGQIIRRIREFVKRSEPRRQPTPVERIVEDAVGFAQIDASKKSVPIEVDIEPGLPALDADALLIEQVLLNLLNNAIDATVATGSSPRPVRLRVNRYGAFAEVQVIDQGTGIADAQRARLFQPFFSTKPEGMGMGLAICRSIVEYHGGGLTLETNPPPASGTTARFTLPLAADASTQPAIESRLTIESASP